MCSPKLLCLPPVANTLRDLDMRFTWVVVQYSNQTAYYVPIMFHCKIAEALGGDIENSKINTASYDLKFRNKTVLLSTQNAP